MVLIILGIFIIYLRYLKVNLDETSEGDLLLWYGRKERNYIKIWRGK